MEKIKSRASSTVYSHLLCCLQWLSSVVACRLFLSIGPPQQRYNNRGLVWSLRTTNQNELNVVSPSSHVFNYHFVLWYRYCSVQIMTLSVLLVCFKFSSRVTHSTSELTCLFIKYVGLLRTHWVVHPAAPVASLSPFFCQQDPFPTPPARPYLGGEDTIQFQRNWATVINQHI